MSMKHKVFIKRRENRLHQKDVAKKIGMHKQTYSRKERGEQDFTIGEGVLLAKLYGCTLDELFGEDDHVSKIGS